MNKKTMNLFLGITFVMTSFAFAEENGEPTPEVAAEQAYVFQCAPLDKVVKLVGRDMKDLTEADLKELIDMRKSTFDVIKRGKPALKEILDEGNKSDTGPFGAILTCGVVEQIAAKVKSRGCLNLETNEKIKGGPGIKACQELLKKLK